MIKVENIKVYGIADAITNIRNSYNSWEYSDSGIEHFDDVVLDPAWKIGEKDLKLIKSLINSGHSSHRKFMRQIYVGMNVTGPLYWWKQFDTYKVGTVSNSTSTMHSILKKPLTLDCFTYHEEVKEYLQNSIDYLNKLILNDQFNEDNFDRVIELLHEGYNQMRYITMSFENVYHIINERETHKLKEWGPFCKICKDIPYYKDMVE